MDCTFFGQFCNPVAADYAKTAAVPATRLATANKLHENRSPAAEKIDAAGIDESPVPVYNYDR